MQPQELCADSFSRYPPQAKALAVSHLAILRQMPLALVAIILREIIDYDWRFPKEQRVLVHQFNYLDTLQPAPFAALMAPFVAVRLPNDMSESGVAA